MELSLSPLSLLPWFCNFALALLTNAYRCFINQWCKTIPLHMALCLWVLPSTAISPHPQVPQPCVCVRHMGTRLGRVSAKQNGKMSALSQQLTQ